MKSLRGKILIFYAILLIASWLVMSFHESSPSLGDNWKSISINTGNGKSPNLCYRVFPGNNPSATPLILIHGSPMASSCFDPLLKNLSNDRTILVPDLPGFGNSYRGFSDLSFPAQSEALNQMLDHEKIKEAHWLAYSQGGGPVITLASKHPKTFASLTLLSSIGVQEHELTGDYFLNHILHGTQRIALEALRWGIPHFGLFDSALINTHYAKIFYQSDLRPLRAYLNEFIPPTLIIHGDTDALVTPASALEHQRIIPQSDLTWMKGGHMLLMKEPQQVSYRLENFLNDVDSKTAPIRAKAETERLERAALPFDSKTIALTGYALLITLLAIALATLASEDLACIAAGLLVARGLISLPHGIAAAFVGIWIGDMALYAAGRYGGIHIIRCRPICWLISKQSIENARSFLTRKGAVAILISRFTPGLRLPLYVASGIVKVPCLKIAAWFFFAGILWSIPVVSLTAYFGQPATDWLLNLGIALFPLAILLLVSVFFILKMASHLITHRGRRILLSKWNRAIKWEFWPPCAFYPPLACIVVWMAIRRGRPLACTAVNPAIPHGGICGESKSMILDQLLTSGAVIPFLKLPDGDASQKIAAATNWHNGFPLVIKPDVGERGRDVVIVKNQEQLETEIKQREMPTLIQHYAEGAEYGVFYIRHPDEQQGHIFSITKKIMTSVRGDGIKSLEELILDDDRAFLSQQYFRTIHVDSLTNIPKNSEEVPLAKLGSHCRGALFLNGNQLITPQLEAEIHRIASAFRGFHFGRFDLRCPDDESLKNGEGIRIIELNGLTSEATHIYHPNTPLITAYRTLVSQWRQAIEIGNHNAKHGAHVSKSSELFSVIIHHFFPKKMMTSTLEATSYRIRTTRNKKDIQSAQRLRYAVFNVELGEGLDTSDQSGLDADPFDAQCDHLIIEEQGSGEVIGTYRLQTGNMAAAGLGYYSATEFDFTPYEPLRNEILELGRACIHANHRKRAVLDLLWSGIAGYAQSHGSRYLLGCSSLTSQSPEEGWGLYEQLADKFLAPPELRTNPAGKYIMPRPENVANSVKTPKLFAAYLTVGAWIAGPPAIDVDFKTIDFLTILDLHKMSSAGKKHFFKNVS